MSELRSTRTRSRPQSWTRRRESPNTGDRSWPAAREHLGGFFEDAALGDGEDDRSGHGGTTGWLLLGALDLRTNGAQLLLDRLVSAIEVVDPQHLGLAGGDQAGEDQAGRRRADRWP